MGRTRASSDWIQAIGPVARAAIDRIMEEPPGIGEALMFPPPTNSGQAITKDLASEWLLEP